MLIDEIGLHLHPMWQRMVIPQCAKVFPNCQFIVSSHSPHVLTHVKPESVFLFEQTEAGIVSKSASESYGKNADRILEDLMGLSTTRPETVSRRLSEIYRLIDRGSVRKAKTQILDLKKDIGDDPELVKAEVLVKRKEILGR